MRKEKSQLFVKLKFKFQGVGKHFTDLTKICFKSFFLLYILIVLNFQKFDFIRKESSGFYRIRIRLDPDAQPWLSTLVAAT